MSATMPFGKHRGQLRALPRDYLNWLTTIDLRPWLREAVDREMDHREAEEPRPSRPRLQTPKLAEELITAGTRQLARRYHPDAGGSHEQMLSVNAAADWLRSTVRGLHA